MPLPETAAATWRPAHHARLLPVMTMMGTFGQASASSGRSDEAFNIRGVIGFSRDMPSDRLARIKPALGVQQGAHTPLHLELDRVKLVLDELLLQRADAVLASDRSTE